MSTTQPAGPNRLRHATSPYLQQHAHNPVDWYEWGPEALDRARREDRPIFLSIGYAACHWCHVMARESFENPAVAALLNRSFVNIKVDREERPDLDEIYMQATLALNHGQGGWPMSVWLTPDLKPFFAGTYFPPASRYGRPGFADVCERIAAAWQHDRARIAEGADQLAEIVRAGLRAEPAPDAAVTLELVDRAVDLLAGAFDAERGGLPSGSANKFPPSLALDLLLRAAARRPAGDAQRQRLLGLVRLTLAEMAKGGIYDQLGGGIHRYSTDPDWHVPHFEKMLYDQALVSRAYLDAWQLTREPLFERIAREILDYVLADLRAPEGGFYSARDADSEGVEGRYYVWTRAEVLAALGPEDGELFCAHYDVRADGNWRDPHDPAAAKNVLRVRREVPCVAKMCGVDAQRCAARLAAARARLLAIRAQRTPPARDDKILCEWNGLMIASLARAGAAFDEPRYTAAAAAAADFILREQHTDGRLHRAWRAGRTQPAAFLSDYAALIEGLLELHEATFDPRWLGHAARLNAAALERFWDPDAGGFFFTAADHETLLTRSKDVRDGAVPSGNSLQLSNLLRLAALLGDDSLRARAETLIAALAGEVLRTPWASERCLCGVELARLGPLQITIVGEAADPRTRALLREVYRTYLPNRALVLHDPAQPATRPATPPIGAPALVDGRPVAHVCRAGTCLRPVTSPDELARQLAGP